MRRRGVALLGGGLALLSTACADPSRIVYPPPHSGVGRTTANGGLAITVQRVQMTELRSAGRVASTYGLDFRVVVQNRAWRDGGVSVDRRLFALEEAGTLGRLIEFRACGRADSIGPGESVEGTVRFALDALPAPRSTLVLRSPTDAALVRVDFAPPTPRLVTAPPLGLPPAGASDERPPSTATCPDSAGGERAPG